MSTQNTSGFRSFLPALLATARGKLVAVLIVLALLLTVVELGIKITTDWYMMQKEGTRMPVAHQIRYDQIEDCEKPPPGIDPVLCRIEQAILRKQRAQSK